MSESETAPAVNLETQFRLDSIVEAEAPQGSAGVWHRYIIRQGSNTIVGTRAGTREELLPQIEQMVERLNERNGKLLSKQRR